MFGRSLVTDVILPNASGQPGLVASPVIWLAHDIQPHVAMFNVLATGLQLAIGLALMFRLTARPALAVSFVWAGLIWFAGEGLGGLLTGAANPVNGAPGAALLYIVAGAMVWPRRGTGDTGDRLAWAALWLGSAALWLLPANAGPRSVHDAVAAAPSGARWLSGLQHAVAAVSDSHGTLVALVLAAVSVAIALSALTRAAQRTFLGLGITLNVVFWFVGQGMGGILTGSGTDISTAPLVVLMGWMLLARIRAGYAAAPATSPSSPAAGARMAAPRRSFSSALSPVPRSTR
jgi:hypothetical protein